MGSPEPMPSVEEAVAVGVPDDADDLRGYHFKRLIGKTLTIALLGSLALIAFVAAGIAVSPLIGLLAGVAVLVIGGPGRPRDRRQQGGR